MKKNTIFADSLKVKDESIESLILQKPNSTVLGYPLRLNLYNLAKPNPDSSYQLWLHKKDKRQERLAELLSQKQVDRLGESFLVKGLSEWLKEIGEAPVIIDTSETRRTLERLSAYYGSKGYFNNNTTYHIDTLSNGKNAKMSYQIELDKPFIIDTISQSISSPAIDSIYRLNTKASSIKPGDQFDLAKFTSERERLTTIFRNTGVYNFQESSINFNLLTDTTKLADDQLIDVELNIEDLRRRGDSAVTTSKYQVFRFDKINIYTDYLYNESEREQNFIRYGDYTIFYRGKLRFKPKTLADAIFFKKDSVYRDIDRVRTYRQINNLNVFKYPNINSVPDSIGNKLTTNIYLSARPKYSLGTALDVTHSNIQQVGLAVSPSLQARNLFRGAENLSLSGRFSIGSSNDPNINDNRFFNIREFGADVNLNLPRIWFPFVKTSKLIPSYTLPKTRISLGTSFQKNIGLDKQTFNSIFGYNWTPSDQLKNNLELFNIQFVRNVKPEQFFNVYQSSYSDLNTIARTYQNDPTLADFFIIPEGSTEPNLIIPSGTEGFTGAILNNQVAGSTFEDERDVSRIEERRVRLTENNLIFASNYSLSLNNRKDIADNQFYQVRMKFESAGNVLSLFSNVVSFNKNENGDLLVFGVPFSQYLKGEIDFVKYWDLSHSNVLAFRSFLGLAVPYGNSTNVPFVRSYFAGGANDNRAWFPYSLGPGKTNALQDFNEANFKIAFNLEYRFPVAGNIKGALFADAGNIWNVFDDQNDPDATFNGLESLADIALGTGFGLRYDFTYFLFRVDLGFKTYNPAEEPSKRWFRDYNFGNSVLQIGINYPF